MGVLFTGGDCAEDLAVHLREPLHRTRGLSVCSPDTALRGVKELACDSEPLARMFERLNANDVTIGRFRADSASHQQDVVDLLQTHTDRFYIRAKRSAEMLRQIGAIDEEDWTSVTLEWQPMNVAELADWRPFDGNTSYRLIVSRIKRDDQQGDLFSGSDYTYRYILGLYSERIPWLKATYRLKKFIFRFISVPAKWIRSGRQNILKLYTHKDYELLLE